MRRLRNKAVLLVKQVRSKVSRKRHKPQFAHAGVPYFSQWESRELVAGIVTKKIDAKDDPRWRESGARNVHEYASWSWSGCGMACLKMILACGGKVVPLVDLGKRCLRYGGYKLPLEKHPGLFYKPFVAFIKNEYGLRGKAVSALTVDEMKQAISDGGFVMASVTPEIRFPDKIPAKGGGHLVLVHGYDDKKRAIYLHNPSGFKDSQENVAVPYGQFDKFFNHKGIIIYAR